jgi:hypothetical protein
LSGEGTEQGSEFEAPSGAIVRRQRYSLHETMTVTEYTPGKWEASLGELNAQVPDELERRRLQREKEEREARAHELEMRKKRLGM